MQEKLVELLKHKGIGPQGSKHISLEECRATLNLLQHQDCSLTTKATFLTALFLLDKDENEKQLCLDIQENIDILDSKLHFIITGKAQNELENIILKAIAKKDLSQKEAELGISQSFHPETDEHLTAAFLEALRLKRETDLENSIFYKYFLAHTSRSTVDYDVLIELGDSYDGVKRNNNYNLFTACLLGALGYKTIITGNKTVAPKNGVTHHQILLSAQKNPLISYDAALKHLDQNHWTYLDQAVFYPTLWEEKSMREEMVKRPCIATFEKMLSPIANKRGNHLITSYTHAHYKHANIEIIKHSPYITTALNVKGLEGTITPKQNVSTPIVKWENDLISESKHYFSDETLEATEELSAEETLKLGVDFIQNNAHNQASQYIKNTVSLILTNITELSSSEVLEKIEDAILNNKVYDLWSKSMN